MDREDLYPFVDGLPTYASTRRPVIVDPAVTPYPFVNGLRGTTSKDDERVGTPLRIVDPDASQYDTYPCIDGLLIKPRGRRLRIVDSETFHHDTYPFINGVLIEPRDRTQLEIDSQKASREQSNMRPWSFGNSQFAATGKICGRFE